jgi:hypothetical protein
MIRLDKHDELVEAMARAFCTARGLNPDTLFQVFDDEYPIDATDERGRRFIRAWRKSVIAAAAALDALLAAVVEKGVGELTAIEIGQYPDRIDPVGRLILKLEPKS